MKIFISYRLRQVDRVRPIVDLMRAAELAVWFNEYDILLHNNTLFDESAVGVDGVKANLKEAVESGCTHAVIFSNNEWADSGYCSAEADAILANMELSNIVQVHIPDEDRPHVKYPALKDVRQLVYHGDSNETAKDIVEQFGEKPVPTEPYPSGQQLEYSRAGLMVDPGFFSIDEEKTNALGDPNHILFRGAYSGSDIRLGVRAYPFQATVDGLSYSVDELDGGDEGVKDYDIQLRNSYLEFVKEWSREQSLDITGLNVFFHDGRTHFAVTYETDNTIERRFVLSLKANPIEAGEIHFIFYVMKSDYADAEEARLDFFRCCPVFDEFMNRIEYEPALDISQVFPTGFARVVYSILAILALRSVADQQNLSGFRLLLAVLCGMVLADSLLFMNSARYRRFLAVFGMRGILSKDHESSEEVWGEIFSHVVAYVPSLLTSFVVDTFYMVGTRFGFSIPALLPGVASLWIAHRYPELPFWNLLGVLVAGGVLSQTWLVLRLLKRSQR